MTWTIRCVGSSSNLCTFPKSVYKEAENREFLLGHQTSATVDAAPQLGRTSLTKESGGHARGHWTRVPNGLQHFESFPPFIPDAKNRNVCWLSPSPIPDDPSVTCISNQ
ncbi:hypothetical protein TNCV_2007521 [Trichonephila clavipes]|nr:hypothetical protein TNCV_2007521 [Trichonephila clavipes]